LLQALKDWRREQARSQGLPPYVVFHDRTLVEVVARRPRSLQALAEISGIGQAKLDRYGPALLEALELGLTAGAGGSPAG
jgi:ATP-dependent DNA helicase RecQ